MKTKWQSMRDLDKELAAIKVVIDALKPLKDDKRVRVLIAAHAMLDIEPGQVLQADKMILMRRAG